MISVNIKNETAQLESVVLGTADSFGGTPKLEDCYDPKSRMFVEKNEFPSQSDVSADMESLLSVFNKYNISVYRPKLIEGLNQIFSRDIGFVIGDTYVYPKIIENRREELQAIQHIVDQIKNVVFMPENASSEGGDVMPHNEYLFVGYSEEEDFGKYEVARTNKAAIDFFSETFTNCIVKGFELNKSDDNPKYNALHLDCCFQPIGANSALIYEAGFKNKEDVDFLINYFGEENLIRISRQEMYEMNSNIFSISTDVVVSEKGFTRLNNELRKRGFTVEEVRYSEISKMEGLLRCSTLPLKRK